MTHTQLHRQRALRLFRIATLVSFVLGSLPGEAFASAWDPTLLVNTEAFQIIDDGDGASPIYLQFGDAANERLTWDLPQSEFEFTDDVSVEGNLGVTGSIAASGALTINNDNSGDATINFGGSVVETMNFNASTNRFELSDDVAATGNIYGSGTITAESTIKLNADDSGDATLNFGQNGGDETLNFNSSNGRFEFSDDVHATLNLTSSGSAIVESTIKLNADDSGDATLNFGQNGGDETLNFNSSVGRFELSDDVHATLNLTSSGSAAVDGTIKLNSDDSGDATLSFGQTGGDETMIFNATTGRFEFSDDVHATGDIRGSGALSIEGVIYAGTSGIAITTAAGTIDGEQIADDTIDDDSIDFIDVTAADLTFAEGDITDSTIIEPDLSVDNTPSDGDVLTYDATGTNFNWVPVSSLTVGDGSGTMLSFHPEYPNATYAGTGATTVGQLSLNSSGSTAGTNYYRWTTTQAAAQRYQIVVRAMVPYNFDSWGAGTGMYLQYRTDDTSTANNFVQFKVWDTAGALDHNSGVLAGPNANAFVTAAATPANLDGTYTPGDFMTVRIIVMATTSNPADVGFLNFQWKSNTP